MVSGKKRKEAEPATASGTKLGRRNQLANWASGTSLDGRGGGVRPNPPTPPSLRAWLSLREKWAEQRSYQNLLWIGRMEHGLHAKMVQSSGKCALTLHSCISVTDRVKINELNTSIATGPLYVHTEFEAI